jgi:enamine deaminase RidA (YjgF/YER057c/UK114 family)
MDRTMSDPNSSFNFGLPWEDAAGYSQGLRRGSVLRISGQLSHDLDGNFLHAGDFIGQARVTFENLDRVLAHFGAQRHDVIETNIYIRDIRENFTDFAALHKEYFGDHRPASNAFGVVGLALPDQLIEVAAHVILPE